MPLFFLAWPVAILTGNLLLTFATFVGVYLTFCWFEEGLGAADGKIAVGLAGFAPPALLASVLVQGIAFLYARLRGKGKASLPGVVGFYIGAVMMTFVLVLCEHMKARV